MYTPPSESLNAPSCAEVCPVAIRARSLGMTCTNAELHATLTENLHAGLTAGVEARRLEALGEIAGAAVNAAFDDYGAPVAGDPHGRLEHLQQELTTADAEHAVLAAQEKANAVEFRRDADKLRVAADKAAGKFTKAKAHCAGNGPKTFMLAEGTVVVDMCKTRAPIFLGRMRIL